MPITRTGQIIDEQGNLTGGEVNLATGQITKQNTTSPITSQSLSPTPSINFQGSTTGTVTTPKVEDFTPAQPTTKETDISALIKQINTAESALAGESATFRTEEEKRLGFERLKTEEGDLFSQLKQQQAEFENLQAEDVRIEERMQQQATGRGITAGGLQPLTTSELRKNFLIKSEKAAQVNVTAALLAGTQNKLLTAQSLVDRAVKNKFGAREAEQTAKINNLELLLKDPTLSVEQANRANAQLAKEKKNQEANTKKKEDAQKILEWAVESRKNGASALEAQQIANIGLSNTPDMAKAFEIYSKYQPKEKETGIVAEYQFYAQQEKVAGKTPLSFNDYQTLDANRKAKIAAAGIAGKVSQPTQAVINNPSLFDDLTPTMKGVIIGELQANGYDTSNLGTKGLSDSAIKEISQSQKALADLDELKAIIKGKENLLGPITGLQRFNPYSSARKLQADVDRVRQTVGKALEGGVLRKEDEDKYKKILATLSDTPDTAIYKIDALVSSIQRDIENYKSLQQSSGKSLDVKASLKKGKKVLNSAEARSKYDY